MKKVILALIVCISMIFIFTGCSKEMPVNVENDNSINDNSINDNSISGSVLGKSALTKIGEGLWYDTTTRIVYWWNGRLSNIFHPEESTTPSPYYASNGLPYRYNPETKSFEEIQ